MKKIFHVLPLAFALLATSCGLLHTGPELADGAMLADGVQNHVYVNGIRPKTVKGESMFINGGCMLQVGNYIYWYGEHRYGSGNAIGVSCYRSTDMVNWEWRCDIIDESSSEEINPFFLERPKVIYNPNTGKYVLWGHREGTGWNYGVAQYIVAVGDAPDEPFKFVKSGRPFDDPTFNIHDNGYTDEKDWADTDRPYGYMSRDCTLFVDDIKIRGSNGNEYYPAYFMSSYRENTHSHIYRLTEDYLDIDTTYIPTDNVLNTNQREAPCLFKKDGIYYAICSGTDGWNITPTNWQYAYDLQGPWSGKHVFGDTDGDGNTGYAFHADRSQPAFVFELKATDGSGNSTFLYLGDKWGPAFGGSSTYDSQCVWSVVEFRSPTDLYTAYSDALIPNVEKGTITYPQYYYIGNDAGQWLTQAKYNVPGGGNTHTVYPGQIASWADTVITADDGGTRYRDPYVNQWRFVPTSTGYILVNRWSGLALTCSGSENLSTLTLNLPDAENEYQKFSLDTIMTPYYRIKSNKTNGYLSTYYNTTHGSPSQTNGTNSLWLTSWGYYVGWQGTGNIVDEKVDQYESARHQMWKLIPVNPDDNMSMVQ